MDIAFRRKVRETWLQQGLESAAEGGSWMESKAFLASLVGAEVKGSESLRKVLTHIRRVWFDPPDHCIGLHAQAIALSHTYQSKDAHVLLHWGMTLAAYPSVGIVATHIGRSLKLQDDFLLADVQKRMRSQFGEREYVSRVTRYVVSSFLDWGVIDDSEQNGAYKRRDRIEVKDTELLAWVAEAILLSSDRNQMSMVELSDHPALFPFSLGGVNAHVIQVNPRLRIDRQSLNTEHIVVVGKTRQ